MSTVPSHSDCRPIGVLLAQLGTPSEPTPRAVRSFLRQFLSDPRVVDLPAWKWWPILYGVVLPFRPRRSARLYRRVWTSGGAPLLVHSRAQEAGLQQRLGDGFRVVLAMRYGQPDVETGLNALAGEGIDRVLVFPLFPQFSSSTTGSICDAVAHHTLAQRGRRRHVPTLRFVPPFYSDPAYIDSLRARVQETVANMAEGPGKYLMTFHGVPERYVAEGDPYRRHCEETARLLAAALSLSEDQWLVGFQSRFGREPWLRPYTDEVLIDLAGAGVRQLLTVCPGFTADCLETVDELGVEGSRQFTTSGGESLHLVPCLNDHPTWLDAMAAIVHRETAGWTS